MLMDSELRLFLPKKCEAPEEWKTELESKASECDALIRAGAERLDDVQQYFVEAIWAALRRDIPAARLAELFAQTLVPRKEYFQRMLADAVWLVGFAATEQPQDKEMKQELEALCTQLSAHNVVSKAVLALALEIESLPASVCSVATLRKKHNQAKTKARYTIQRFNLLREHNEGYARLLFMLDRLASCDWQPAATKEQMEETQNSIIDHIFRLIGYSNLCPNRILCMVIDVYEQRLSESDSQVRLQPLVALLGRFPQKRITEAVVFQLLAHAPAPAAGGAPSPPTGAAPPSNAVDLTTPPSRPSQFLAIAALIAHGLVDLDALWPYLEPKDKDLKETYSDLLDKYETDLSKVTKVDLGGSAPAEKDRNNFQQKFQEFNAAKHPKFRLAAALISVNCWHLAHKVLLNLQQVCKPVLNDFIRSALCDLLKWIMGPVLRPTQKKLPHQNKATLDTTFRSTRRFGLGLALASGDSSGNGSGDGAAAETAPAPRNQGEGLLALKPTSEVDQLIPQVKVVLEHLEYFLHTDMHLLTSLWRILALHLMQKEKANGNGSPATLDQDLVSMIFRSLLPAASLVQHNPSLSDLMWSVLSKLSVYQRYLIYGCWESMYDHFLLRLVQDKTKMAAKQILKRVVSNAERKDLIAHQSHFHFCKLCHSNPIPALETMLKDVEIGFNVNLIPPYVECTNKCPDMTADVMAFVLTRSCSKPVTSMRPMLNQADATLASWLTNIAELTGRFYKKHPTTDLVGLLTSIARRISCELEDKDKREPGAPPTEYKGESLIRVVLENLIEFMGGYTTVADMNADQLVCLAGGPRLQSASISSGKQEEAKSKERARAALFNAIVDLGLVRVLWNSLSQQRHHFLSEDFAEAHSGSSGLKLLTLLFDGNHSCLLKLTEFLAQACPREKYSALLPPIQDVFQMFEPALAFLAVRHGLAPYGRPAPAISVEAESPDAPDTPLAEPLSIESELGADMVQVINSYIPRRKFELDGISVQFYVTFWRLSLQDIVQPTEGYEKAIAHISQTLSKHEQSKKQMERQVRDHTRSREYKALKKEVARLTDFHGKVKEEQLQQKLNHDRVVARLEQEKRNWFMKPSPQATVAFVHEMIYARVLVSYSDALFCSNFVKLLIKLKTPGFHLLDFYNSWTIMLTQCLRSCSEREAKVFGVFLREMMLYILHLRKDEKTFQEEMKDNPAFYRNYREEPTKKDNFAPIEWTNFSDIKKGHSKWEGRIFKVMRLGLEGDDWMEKRNALLLLSQSYEAYPMVEKYATLVSQTVQSMQEKEESSDLKTLATSLTMKLRMMQERWVDRGASTTTSSSTRKPEDGGSTRRAKNPLSEKAAAKDGPSGDAGKAEPRDRDRDRDRAANGGAAAASGNGSSTPAAGEKRPTAEQEGGPEKRARRDEEDHKEAKDGKARDRADSKALKESKEAREKRLGSSREKDAAAEKPRAEKDRDREKASERSKVAMEKDKAVQSSSKQDTRETDRKRSATSSSAPPAAQSGGATLHAAGSGSRSGSGGGGEAPARHEEGEKRRRTESRGAGDERGSTSDRYGGGSSHHPRNALTSNPEPSSGNSQHYSGSGGGGGGTSRSAPAHDYSRSSGRSGYNASTSGGGHHSEGHRRRGR